MNHDARSATLPGFTRVNDDTAPYFRDWGAPHLEHKNASAGFVRRGVFRCKRCVVCAVWINTASVIYRMSNYPEIPIFG